MVGGHDSSNSGMGGHRVAWEGRWHDSPGKQGRAPEGRRRVCQKVMLRDTKRAWEDIERLLEGHWKDVGIPGKHARTQVGMGGQGEVPKGRERAWEGMSQGHGTPPAHRTGMRGCWHARNTLKVPG